MALDEDGIEDGLFLKFLGYNLYLLTFPTVGLLEIAKIKISGVVTIIGLILLDAIFWAFVTERIISLIKKRAKHIKLVSDPEGVQCV